MLNTAGQTIWMNRPHSARHQSPLTKTGGPVRPATASAAAAIEHRVSNNLDANFGLDGRIFCDARRMRSAVMSTKLSCVSAHPIAVRRNDHASKGTPTSNSIAFESQVEVEHAFVSRTRTPMVNNKIAIS